MMLQRPISRRIWPRKNITSVARKGIGIIIAGHISMAYKRRSIRMLRLQVCICILDNDCGSHICQNIQMIRNSRRLAKDEIILCIKNGAKIPALAVRICTLSLPTELTLELSNYYYIPNITKNII